MSLQMLRILVGREPQNGTDIESELRTLGHNVVGVAGDGTTAVSMARATSPDLVILSLTLPLLAGLDAAARIYEERPVPIVIVAAGSEAEPLARAAAMPVYAYLVEPVSAGQLQAGVEIAHARHAAIRDEQIHRAELAQRLEDRKVIERAKGILMKRDGLSESDAYRMLQRTSQSRNVSMADLSRSLLAAESLIAAPGAPAAAPARSQPQPPRPRPSDLR